MIRRFNYTNRKSIERKDIPIQITRTDGLTTFDADLSALVDYGLPPDSQVFVEAYRQTNWKRFDFGQVGAIKPAPDRDLSHFESPELLLFRVKVTPNGNMHKLLAEADQIPLTHPEPNADHPEPEFLLEVKRATLEEIYQIEFTDTQPPLLLINKDAGDYIEIGRSSAFRSLVYPAVFREILNRILLIDQYDANDTDGPKWVTRWLKFASLYQGVGEPPNAEDTQDCHDWVDKAVKAFAKKLQARAEFAKYWENER